MSTKYPGGFITKNYVAPTPSSAPGIWTLDQQLQAQKAGIWPFGGPFTYIEDVFSTYLYTANNSTQTIVNGIDLAGKGGLVWNKSRTYTYFHNLYDTTRGINNRLFSNDTSAANTASNTLTSFNSNGFTVGSNDTGNFAGAGNVGVSWTFRKQPKFFDVVTWTGNDASNRQIAHNLGSIPGCIIARAYTTTSDWSVYHRSLGNTKALYLNLTQEQETNTNWGNTTPTSSVFTTNLNGAGNTYIAYIFAHDAGGFGLTGTDNVISCGSYTGNGSSTGPTITLGYEPQWLLVKSATVGGTGYNWALMDNMRGFPVGSSDAILRANLSDAEVSADIASPTATGFQIVNSDGSVNASGQTYIYIAIRRGPMAVPTTGTSVFAPYNAADTTTQTVGFPTDMYFDFNKTGAPYNVLVGNRLVGTTAQLFTQSTAAESNTYGPSGSFASNTTFAPSMIGAGTAWYSFRRAPSFFDVVCYTGTGVARTVAHNLAAVPELMIVKARNDSFGNWAVYPNDPTDYLILNNTGRQFDNDSYWNDTAPTSNAFTVGTSGETNGSGYNYISYLFATCAGVSKVGSYTGNGTTQTIDCGFGAGGARFVLIKRTDASGDWYTYDTARGMTVLTDPYLLLNSSAAETATLGSVTTVSTGFALNASVLAAINTNAATYIFLAIA
jgi:hypothetical protein